MTLVFEVYVVVGREVFIVPQGSDRPVLRLEVSPGAEAPQVGELYAVRLAPLA